MYSFVYSNSRNRLGVEKAEALIYIYTNSLLLHQRLNIDPVRNYDDNIFSEDSNDDGGTHSNTDEDNNDDNSGQGHDGNDGDAFNEEEEHPREYPPINLGNVHLENHFDWTRLIMK
jgi:hypothetical protein